MSVYNLKMYKNIIVNHSHAQRYYGAKYATLISWSRARVYASPLYFKGHYHSYEIDITLSLLATYHIHANF